jgi:hypothetical protein
MTLMACSTFAHTRLRPVPRALDVVDHTAMTIAAIDEVLGLQLRFPNDPSGPTVRSGAKASQGNSDGGAYGFAVIE